LGHRGECKRHHHHATRQNGSAMRNILNLPNKERETRRGTKRACEAGFSLIELMIAMAIVLVMMTGATQLLMSSLGARTRETQKSDALADAQRALNIMS